MSKMRFVTLSDKFWCLLMLTEAPY